MFRRWMATKNLLVFVLFISTFGSPAAEAGEFTIGLKGFYASRSTDNVEDDENLFDPGVRLAWDVTDRLWLSTAYIGGEVNFRLSEFSSGRIEEVDFDIVVGWSFDKIDLGVGYRSTEFTTTFVDVRSVIESAGPMVFLGGDGLFGRSPWGFYWGVAYMFEDLEDDDGTQEHINGEAGLLWTSKRSFSILLGYRHKEYSGDGTAALRFAGPAVTFSYTFSAN